MMQRDTPHNQGSGYASPVTLTHQLLRSGACQRRTSTWPHLGPCPAIIYQGYSIWHLTLYLTHAWCSICWGRLIFFGHVSSLLERVVMAVRLLGRWTPTTWPPLSPGQRLGLHCYDQFFWPTWEYITYCLIAISCLGSKCKDLSQVLSGASEGTNK